MKYIFLASLLALSLSACKSESSSTPAEGDSLSGAAASQAPATNASTGAPEFNGKDPLYQELEVAITHTPVAGLKVGDELSMTFAATMVNHDWHLYSARKDGKIAYNPTELILFEDECKGLALAGDMAEDKTPQEREDKVLGGLVRDFQDHQVNFTQKLKLTGAEVVLEGEFAGQYCDPGGACKFVKMPVHWAFQVGN